MRKHEDMGEKSLPDALSLALLRNCHSCQAKYWHCTCRRITTARSYIEAMTLSSEQSQHRHCRRTGTLHTLDDTLESSFVDDKPRGNIELIPIRSRIIPHLTRRLGNRHRTQSYCSSTS